MLTRRDSSSPGNWENLRAEKQTNGVQVIRLHRPKVGVHTKRYPRARAHTRDGIPPFLSSPIAPPIGFPLSLHGTRLLTDLSPPFPVLNIRTRHNTQTQALNALNTPLMSELVSALRKADADSEVKAIVLTGSDRAFAAGADIKEMKDKNYAEVYKESFLTAWDAVSTIRKPIVAGVNGFALGGGCELAMMCDIIIAGENAVFG